MPSQKPQSQSISDPAVANALNRVVNQAVKNGRSTEAYLCSLRLPPMFAHDPKTANAIYAKTISDYCKGIYRLPNGETPKYVAISAEEEGGFPLYKFCLFAKPGLDLNAEDGVEHGRYIANSKASEFGFGNGTLDVVQLFLQAPRFSVSEPIAVNEANKADVMDRLQEHLRDKSSCTGDGTRTLFVSKCPNAS